MAGRGLRTGEGGGLAQKHKAKDCGDAHDSDEIALMHMSGDTFESAQLGRSELSYPTARRNTNSFRGVGGLPFGLF
jgi:hypothetical protein